MLSGEDNHQSILSEIVQEIIKTEANLFNEFDLLILNQFISLNSIQKYEVQKLINRRHTDIRIDATDVKCSLLKSAPLIVLDRLSFLSLNELLDILSQQELKVITKSLKINSIKQNVDHLRSSILNHSKTQSTLFGQTSSEVTISLIKRTIFKNKRLIYLDQDARNTFHRVFVLYNRTKVWPENDNLMLDCILSSLKSNPKHFFKYEYSRNQDIFKTRLDLIEYIDALKIEFDFSLSMDSNDEDTREKFNSCKVKYSELCEVDQDNAVFPWLECYKPIHVYARIMHNAINFLSKEALKQKKNPGAFTELVQHLNMLINQKYHSKKRGKWYEKLALVLDYHVKDKEAAIGICKRGLDCLNEPLIGVSFRSVLTKRLNKIEKIEIDTEDTPEYNTVCIQAVKHVKSGPGKALYIDEETEEKVHVEELVMRYYIRNGYKVC